MLKMKEIHEISISMKEMLAKLENNSQNSAGKDSIWLFVLTQSIFIYKYIEYNMNIYNKLCIANTKWNM